MSDPQNRLTQFELSKFIGPPGGDGRIIDRYSVGATVFEYHRVEDVPPHYHDCYELELILSGEGTQLLNGESFPFSRGQLTLVSPADIHEFRCSDRRGEAVGANVKFIPDDVSRELWKPLFSYPLPVCRFEPDARFADLLAIVDGVFRYRTLPPVFARRLAAAALGGLLALALSSEPPPSDSAPSDGTVLWAIGYLRRNFRRRVTVSEMAELCHYSPNYFGAVFRREVGLPFNQYLNSLRLNFAKCLLRATALPVSEISAMSGFDSPSYFNRTFKSHFGMAPTETRGDGGTGIRGFLERKPGKEH